MTMLMSSLTPLSLLHSYAAGETAFAKRIRKRLRDATDIDAEQLRLSAGVDADRWMSFVAIAMAHGAAFRWADFDDRIRAKLGVEDDASIDPLPDQGARFVRPIPHQVYTQPAAGFSVGNSIGATPMTGLAKIRYARSLSNNVCTGSTCPSCSRCASGW